MDVGTGDNLGYGKSYLEIMGGKGLRVTHGDIGIAISNPIRKLHVGGTGEVMLSPSTSVTTNSKAGLFWHVSSDYSIGRTEGLWSSPNYQQLELDWPTGIVMDVGTGSNRGYGKSYLEITGGKGLRVTQGNVGIGTLDADSPLTVKGTIHANEVRLDMEPNVAPDYVFYPDYDLMPLDEVEAYINKEKHLPEVPSAAEMEANGVNLKEMNMLLLKKVEELTLHVIRIEKEMKELKK